MSSEVNMSYVLTTYNKLLYLKEVIQHLLKNIEEDEEIIVTDGGSTDGTKEFLQELYNQGKIHRFVSEKDFGESHGFNKAIMLAQGKLIKLLTDDDIFYYPGIRFCKQFMLQNAGVQVINTNGGWVDLNHFYGVTEFTKVYEAFFVSKWVTENHPFSHCALGLLFRRDALPLVGFLRVGFTRADAEYTLRITASRISFVWFTGATYVRILNDSSNSNKLNNKIEEETKQLNAFYGFDTDKIYDTLVVPDKKETASVKSLLRQSKHRLKDLLSMGTGKRRNSEEEAHPTAGMSFHEAQEISLQWLEKVNKREHHFLNHR